MVKYCLSLLAFLPSLLFSQDSSKVQIKLDAFADVYYVAQDGPVTTDGIAFNHSRKNEINLNLALIKAGIEHDKYRANIGLMTGTYSRYNLAHEPVELRNIWEANVGLRLGKGLWLDAGIFSSHMGFESAISTENPTLTRSFVAENSPYYLSGLNLSYKPSDKWSFLLNVSNGWQVIRENNSTKAIGTQIQFKPSDKLLLNSSSFIGAEPAAFGKENLRWFHNFYADLNLSSSLRIIGGIDVGQQTSNSVLTPPNTRTWIGQVLILRYEFNEKYALAARQELYSDPDGVIISPDQLSAYSLNFDYSVSPKAMFRIEGKYRIGNTRQANGTLIYNNTFITTSIAVRL